MQSLEFLVKNLTLKASLFAPEHLKEKNPSILFIHGWTSEMERSYAYAESLTKLGYMCFLFDMRGHGISEGDRNTLSSRDFLDDVLTAYDFFASQKGVDPDNISVVGSSFGGFLAPLLSTKRPVKNIVMRVPADYPNATFDDPKSENTGQSVMEWRHTPKNFSETFALEAVHNFDGKILIIESEKDEQIPHATVQNYVNAVKDPQKLTHIVMKDAPHSIKEGPFKDEVTRILIDWFSTII